MRTAFSLFIAVLAALCVTGIAAAEKPPYDGSSTQLAGMAAVYERVRANGNVMQQQDAEDVGYFRGFVDGVLVPSGPWCALADGRIWLDQVYAVVAKHLRETPERWGMQARDLVKEALKRVWGCSQAGRSEPGRGGGKAEGR